MRGIIPSSFVHVFEEIEVASSELQYLVDHPEAAGAPPDGAKEDEEGEPEAATERAEQDSAVAWLEHCSIRRCAPAIGARGGK